MEPFLSRTAASIRRRPALFRALSGAYHAGLNGSQRLLFAIRPVLPMRLQVFAIIGRRRPTGNIMISPDLSFMYVPVAKSGNSTARRRLLALAGVDVPDADAMGVVHRIQGPYRSLADYSGEALRRVLTAPGMFRFTFVRNPYHRLVSAYRDKILDLNGNQTLTPFRHDLDFSIAGTPTFEQFARRVAASRDEGSGRHWMSQYRLTLSDLIAFDFIGKVENFGPDFALVLERIGVSPAGMPEVQDLNRTRATPPATDGGAGGPYSAELAGLVYDRYRKDFELFGYARDSWREVV